MKKTLIILIALSLTFVSCSKEEEGTPVTVGDTPQRGKIPNLGSTPPTGDDLSRSAGIANLATYKTNLEIAKQSILNFEENIQSTHNIIFSLGILDEVLPYYEEMLEVIFPKLIKCLDESMPKDIDDYMPAYKVETCHEFVDKFININIGTNHYIQKKKSVNPLISDSLASMSQVATDSGSKAYSLFLVSVNSAFNSLSAFTLEPQRRASFEYVEDEILGMFDASYFRTIIEDLI